jgi:hypothetical protein
MSGGHSEDVDVSLSCFNGFDLKILSAEEGQDSEMLLARVK